MPDPLPIEDACTQMRGRLNDIDCDIRRLMDRPFFRTTPRYTGQHSEMRANIMLAVRHAEDARFRMDTVWQWATASD